MVRGEAKLFIGQIPSAMTQNEILRLFAAYGDIVDVYVLRDHLGHPKGAAFVTFASTEEADTAIAALHNRYHLLASRPMQVSYAKNSPNISPYGHHIAVDVAVRNHSNPMPGAIPKPNVPMPALERMPNSLDSASYGTLTPPPQVPHPYAVAPSEYSEDSVESTSYNSSASYGTVNSVSGYYGYHAPHAAPHYGSHLQQSHQY